MNLESFFPIDVQAISSSLWMIIALPLLGAFLCGVFGRALGRANTSIVACAAVGGSLLLSTLVFFAIQSRSTAAVSPFGAAAYAVGQDYGTWFSAGSFKVNFGLYADHLSGTMLLVITGVGLLIHLYSSSYMEHDDGYWRFFAYLNLFVAMMLTLVLADSLVLLFVGWEGVGMCSYLLIGFWYTDPAKAWAGRKAFVTNRIGDFGFLLAMFLLVLWVGALGAKGSQQNFAPQSIERWRTGVAQVGPLNFRALEDAAKAMPVTEGAASVSLATTIEDGPLSGHTFGQVLTAILLLFMLGAAGKSAQLPLYVWLPDAMAGPTPVSALIHAATMVTAGLYLFCRLSYFLVLSPFAMAVVALIGAATAVLAALIAFAQDDIKKVLAYSTVSQLGMMFMAVGMGVFWAAFLHVVTHAMFKACLFLGAGSVMHGNGDETNIKKLGGLKKDMPWTHVTFLIATLAITGIVPLSGFFSKDSILHGVHSTHLEAYPWVNTVVWGLGLLTAFCTAFYMTRVYWLTFQGERAKDAKLAHAHESAPAMVFPLVVLAFLSVAGIGWGLPRTDLGPRIQIQLENFLLPVFQSSDLIAARSHFVEVHPTTAIPWGAYGLAWAIALAGGLCAVVYYTRVYPARANEPARGLRALALNKFYVDELYEALVLRPIKGLAFFAYKGIDALLIDTVAVKGTAWATARVGSMLRYLQTGDVQSYAAVMALALVGALAFALSQVVP